VQELGSWRDQWARITRWRERVRRSRDEFRDDDLGSEGYRDEVFALFQAIWHLKDWLANDDSLSPALGRGEIESWLSGNSVDPQEPKMLHVAADLANGSKHLKLTRTPRAAGSAQTRRDIQVFVGHGVSHTFWVTDARSGKDYEAVELADLCLAEWTTFLATRGLQTPAGG